MTDSHSANTANKKTCVKETAAEINTADVLAYLRKHRDFYQRHPEALADLQLMHDVTNSASLLEKQITLLRDRNQVLTDQFMELVGTVRNNEKLSLTLHYLANQLLLSLSGEELGSHAKKARSIERVCNLVFSNKIADVQNHLFWFAKFIDDESCDDLTIIRQDDQRITGLVHRIFSSGRPDCGPFNKAERAVLLPGFNSRMASAVVMPLQQPHSKTPIGLVVLSSHDHDKFSPGKGTMFLVEMMQLIEHSFG